MKKLLILLVPLLIVGGLIWGVVSVLGAAEKVANKAPVAQVTAPVPDPGSDTDVAEVEEETSEPEEGVEEDPSPDTEVEIELAPEPGDETLIALPEPVRGAKPGDRVVLIEETTKHGRESLRVTIEEAGAGIYQIGADGEPGIRFETAAERDWVSRLMDVRQVWTAVSLEAEALNRGMNCIGDRCFSVRVLVDGE